MEYCLLEWIDNPAMPWYIYTRYYDIDISPIFTDKTTYFNWLSKDLINIIKCYDLYDIQEGDMIYYKYTNMYYMVMKFSDTVCINSPIQLMKYSYLYGKTIYNYCENINFMMVNNYIKIYRKRLEPSCNII